MKSVLFRAQKAYWYFLDLLFPEDCVGCSARGRVLCQECGQNLQHSRNPPLVDIFALFDYRDPVVKKAIWKLKYHKRSHLGKTLGQLLYEGHLEEISDIRMHAPARSILVIPIPLSRARYKERGYNQAEKIALGFCNSDHEEMLELKKNIVVKKIDTLPQARIANRAKRLKNIKNAFVVTDTRSISGRTIIVIDDVTTTGGTITEVISTLMKAGAKKVYGFAVAH
jgi:ComF family protein